MSLYLRIPFDCNYKIPIKWLSYLIAFFSLILSLCLPALVHCVGTYTTPTASYAVGILNSGHLPEISPSSESWGIRNSVIERNYPLPSMLLSIVVLATGIPTQYIIFLPILGFASIIYFVLAKNILCSRNSYGLLFSALFFSFMLVTNIYAYSVGRATFGNILSTFFIFCFLEYVWRTIKGRETKNWFILCIIFVFASNFTYYQSALGILIATISVSFLLFINQLLTRVHAKHLELLSFSVITTLLFVYNPFMARLSEFSLSEVFANGISFIKATLQLETNAFWLMSYGYVSIDGLTNILYDGFFVLQILSLLSVLLVLLCYPYLRLRKIIVSNNIGALKAWLFALILFFYSYVGIAYLAFASLNPFGVLLRLGAIPLFFIILSLFQIRIQNITTFLRPAKTPFSFFLKSSVKKMLRKALMVLIVFSIILSLIGAFRQNWYYSSSKPFAYDENQKVSEFLIDFLNKSSVIATGDSAAIGFLFFDATIGNKTENLILKTLGEDTSTLYFAELSRNYTSFFERMHQRNIKYFITVPDGEILSGDTWGYKVTVKNFDGLASSSNLIYNGNLKIYGIN